MPMRANVKIGRMYGACSMQVALAGKPPKSAMWAACMLRTHTHLDMSDAQVPQATQAAAARRLAAATAATTAARRKGRFGVWGLGFGRGLGGGKGNPKTLNVQTIHVILYGPGFRLLSFSSIPRVHRVGEF